MMKRILIALALAGCGGEEKAEAASPEAAGRTVAVELGEYFVKPAQTSVAAGEVTFNVSNTGTMEHEFIVYKTDLDPGALPLEGDRVTEDEAAVIGEIEDDELEPGASASLTLTLEPGEYVLFCNLAGHYQLGQYVGFTVTE